MRVTIFIVNPGTRISEGAPNDQRRIAPFLKFEKSAEKSSFPKIICGGCPYAPWRPAITD
jgi:hypothetical protein